MSGIFGLANVNTFLFQPGAVAVMVLRVGDVNAAIFSLDTLFNKIEQNRVFFFFRMKKGADVTVPTQSCPAQPDGSAAQWRVRACLERTLLVGWLRVWHARLYRTSGHATTLAGSRPVACRRVSDHRSSANVGTFADQAPPRRRPVPAVNHCRGLR